MRFDKRYHITITHVGSNMAIESAGAWHAYPTRFFFYELRFSVEFRRNKTKIYLRSDIAFLSPLLPDKGTLLGKGED